MRKIVTAGAVSSAAAFECTQLQFPEATEVCGAMISFASCASNSVRIPTASNTGCASDMKNAVGSVLQKYDSRVDGTRSLLQRHASALIQAFTSSEALANPPDAQRSEYLLSRRLHSMQWELGTHLWLREYTAVRPPKYFLGDTENGAHAVLVQMLARVCAPIPNAAIALLGSTPGEVDAAVDIAPIMLQNFPGVQILLANANEDDYDQANMASLQEAAPDRVIASNFDYAESLQGLPDEYFDVVFALDVHAAVVVTQWLRTVRFAGLLGGVGFDRAHPEVVDIIKAERANMELFLGDGGSWWYLHEPPDE